MYCHTFRALEIMARFLFWSRQWYGVIEFVLWWIQAMRCSVLSAHFLLTSFSVLPCFHIYRSLQYCVSLCQMSSSWCLANAKRHWLKKTYENAEMKLLDYIFFLIPVLKYTLLHFSSSHTQTNTAPCNNKQYWTASL